MSNKRRVVVTVHHRDELSLRDNRNRLGYEAFHWGILIMPKNPKGPDCNAYDVSDGAIVDPHTRQDLNPNREWKFRPKHGVDPVRSGRLIGRIIIGKVGKNITDADIDALLANVPLPAQNATPRQSCVTWTLAAISALQAAGLALSFDIGQFLDWALTFADQCMANPRPNHIYEYGK